MGLENKARTFISPVLTCMPKEQFSCENKQRLKFSFTYFHSERANSLSSSLHIPHNGISRLHLKRRCSISDQTLPCTWEIYELQLVQLTIHKRNSIMGPRLRLERRSSVSAPISSMLHPARAHTSSVLLLRLLRRDWCVQSEKRAAASALSLALRSERRGGRARVPSAHLACRPARVIKGALGNFPHCSPNCRGTSRANCFFNMCTIYNIPVWRLYYV